MAWCGPRPTSLRYYSSTLSSAAVRSTSTCGHMGQGSGVRWTYASTTGSTPVTWYRPGP